MPEDKVEIEDTVKIENNNDEQQQQVLQNVTERLKFFFSDANVRQDYFVRKFLTKTEKEEGDESSPGTIPVETLLRFNTIKKYTTDPAMIVRVVKENLSDNLVLKDEDKSIARLKPFTKDLMSENIPVSLYIKNLPTKEVENDYNNKKIVQYATNVDEMRKLFDQYGDVAIVRMRFKRSEKSDDERHMDDIQHQDPSSSSPTKQPRRRYPIGHCVVEFDNKEDLEKAAADVLTIKDGETLDPKRKLEVGGNTLQVMLLQEYIDEVKKERASESNHDRRKRERDEEGEEDNKNEQEGEEEKLKNVDFNVDWKPGCVIRVQGFPENCDREAILNAVAKSMDLPLDQAEKKVRADYSRGQKNGAIRFFEPEDVGDLVKKMKAGELDIAGTKDFEEVALLEGDEEKKYWDDFIDMRKRQILHRNEERNGPRHRQKRRKGRSNNRGRN